VLIFIVTKVGFQGI